MGRTPLQPGIKVISLDAPASDSANEYWWGTGQIHVKPRTPDHPWLVANEFVCARLAAAVGLPIPAGEIGQDQSDRVAWVTTVIDLNGQLVAPEDVRAIVAREPDLVAGVFVFDVWILNIDRHDENVISHPKLGLWVIDHDQALGGQRTGIPGALAALQDDALGFHAFGDADLDRARLRAWGDRVRAVPRSAVERLVTEGCRRGLYSKDVAAAVVNFILRRQGDVHRLVTRSLPRGGIELDVSADGIAGGTTVEGNEPE
jgi:hypothetical protein